jgi:hypothetical protein
MNINDLIHSEVMSINDRMTIMEEKETGKTVMSFHTDNYGPLEVGDIVVHKVIELGNTHGDQTLYGVNYVETIKKQNNKTTFNNHLRAIIEYILLQPIDIRKKLEKEIIDNINELHYNNNY